MDLYLSINSFNGSICFIKIIVKRATENISKVPYESGVGNEYLYIISIDEMVKIIVRIIALILAKRISFLNR